MQLRRHRPARPAHPTTRPGWRAALTACCLLGVTSAGLLGCADEERYQAATARGEDRPTIDGAPDKQVTLRAAEPQALCGLTPALDADTLDRDNPHARQHATVEETLRADGTLALRAVRWLDDQEAVLKSLTEHLDAQGCVGVRVAEVFDPQGNPLQSRTDVFDLQMGFELSPYMPLESHNRVWTRDEQGRELSVDTDLGNDGQLDHRIETTLDEQGRPTRRTTAFLDDQPRPELWWIGEHAVVETWTYGDDGATVHRKESSAFDQLDVTEVTLDANGNLLRRQITYGEQPQHTEARTWRDDGQPDSADVWQRGGHHSQARWIYNEQGLLLRVESQEDFDLDGRLDRAEVQHFDAQGNPTVFEQDQPFNGVPDWREETTWDERGLKTSHRAMSLPDRAVTSDTRWTYDDQGRVLTEQWAVRGWGESPARLENTWDDQGRLRRAAWFGSRGQLTGEEVTDYDDEAGIATTTRDADADGIAESTSERHFDRGGNLILQRLDHNADGQIDATSLWHFGPFLFE